MVDLAKQILRLASGINDEHLEKAQGMLFGIGKFVVRRFKRTYPDTPFRSRVETDWEGNSVLLSIGTRDYAIEVEASFDDDEFKGTTLYLKSGRHRVKRGFFRRKYPTTKTVMRLLNDHREIVTARQRTAAKEILYHGTKLRNLRGILKKGLIPDASEQAWAEDDAEGSDRLSRISYYGTYLTTNFMTAKQSAPRMEGMIVAVQAETKTLVPDEDDLISGLNRGITVGVLKGSVSNNFKAIEVWVDIREGKNSAEVSRAADKIADYWLGEVKNRKVVNHLKKASKPLLEQLVRDYFERKVAWIKKEEDEFSINKLFRRVRSGGLTPDDILDVSEARRSFRSTFDKVMRKLGVIVEDAQDKFMYKARTVEPITYRGANRILAIMTFDETGDETIVDFPYGEGTTAAKRMIAEWEKVKGKGWQRAASETIF